MIDYTVNDYGPLNRAIEVETEKYRTLNSEEVREGLSVRLRRSRVSSPDNSALLCNLPLFFQRPGSKRTACCCFG